MTLTKVRDRGTLGISTDLQPIKSDISALALREATNENSSAFNLPNQFIETFTDDTNLGTQTQVDRVSGYMATVYTGVGAYSNDSNTVLLLHLDNNVTDSSSNSITVTNNNSASFSSSDYKFGSHSLQLNGTSQYLSTPDMDTVDNSVTTPTTGNYTFEAWFKLTVNDSSSRRMWAIGNNGAPSGGSTPIYSFGRAGGQTQEVNFWGSTPATNVNMNYSGIAYDTNWNHYCVMRSSGTTFFYYNGIRVNDTAHFEDDLTGHSGTLFIGARSGSTGEYVQGYVDEVRYSNIARFPTGSTQGDNPFTPNQITANNSTGTLIQSTNTVGSAKTEVGGTFLYKDNSGTATLGTDLKVYFSCNGGSNWTEASSYNAITPVYSTGIKQVRLGKTTCTSGTNVIYKVEWANQSTGSKETQLHGIGLNY